MVVLAFFVLAAFLLDPSSDEDPTDPTSEPVQEALAEITVLREGTVLVDANATPDNITLFGTAQLGAAGPTVTFTVRNDGPGVLSLGAIGVPPGFSLVEGLPATLVAGAQDTFTVRLDTTTSGPHAGEVAIANNDLDEGLFNFLVTGAVEVPPPPPPPRVENRTVVIGQYNPGGANHFFGCGTNINVAAPGICQGGAVQAVTHTASVGGNQCGYEYYTITCAFPQ